MVSTVRSACCDLGCTEKGGTGVDTLPTVALLERPEVTEIYIIVYNTAFNSGGAQLPFPLNSIDILVNSIATVNDVRASCSRCAC
jgi:hypothetical protein